MASQEKLSALTGELDGTYYLQRSLLDRIQGNNLEKGYKLVPETALELGRLLRFRSGRNWHFSFIATPEFDSFELTVVILSNGCRLSNGETEPVSPGRFFIDIIRSSELPPHCWYHLMMQSKDVLGPLDPDDEDDANFFPLHLCSAILDSFAGSWEGQIQDFDSPSVTGFTAALPYFVDKIYDLVLPMFSEFVKDTPLADPSLPQSLRVFVAATRFLLHRLSLPDFNMSHSTICKSLIDATFRIRYQTFSSQEATALMTVLDDIFAVVLPLNLVSNCSDAIIAYSSLTTISLPVCSLRGLRSMVNFMTSQWDEIGYLWDRPKNFYRSDPACRALTDLLARHIPEAYTAFLENQCLQFLGNHTFREASVPMVSAYIA
ncbi:hypothetical protein IW261DRAFT_1502599, partial [Armillaria novae-zelandiae]